MLNLQFDNTDLLNIMKDSIEQRKNTKSKLILINKHDEYQLYLDFIIPDIRNIISAYTGDEIIINYTFNIVEHRYPHIHCNDKVLINGVLMDIQFVIYFCRINFYSNINDLILTNIFSGIFDVTTINYAVNPDIKFPNLLCLPLTNMYKHENNYTYLSQTISILEVLVNSLVE